MNNELKFRAWNTKRKMWAFRDETLFSFAHRAIMDSEIRAILVLDEQDLEFHNTTTFKDINGVDIYEHDIISDGKMEYEVVWDSGDGQWIKSSIIDDRICEPLADKLDNFKIIGNAYDEPITT